MMVFARRLATGLLAVALMVLWAALIVRLDPHTRAFCAAVPHLAVTLAVAFAGVAFLIGSSGS